MNKMSEALPILKRALVLVKHAQLREQSPGDNAAEVKEAMASAAALAAEAAGLLGHKPAKKKAPAKKAAK